MVFPDLCLTVLGVFRQIEPILVLEQLGNTLFETALQLLVREENSNASYPGLTPEQSRQKAISDFYLTYSLILRLAPILPALLLAKLSDRGWRRAPVVVSLGGYLLSRLTLLLVLLLRLPLSLMFGAAVLYGLCGGYCAFWAGVMTLVSLRSSAADRSKAMMRVELLYGMAGVVGSLVSGHLFTLYNATLGQGVILLIVSTLLHLLIVILAIVLLEVKEVSASESDERRSLCDESSDGGEEAPPAAAVEARGAINWPNIVLLFAAAILYDFAVGGAVTILGIFVLDAPLNWNATQVGYGNAAGCAIFLTSFLGVMLFRRCVGDTALILIGMTSFASGIYFMTFVTATYMYYLARSLTLFALIPMPTIRSMLSQQVKPTSYGTILTSLQFALIFASMAYLPTFTKIYQSTLSWFPGFVFLLGSIFTVLAMVPICVVGCRSMPSQPRAAIHGD